MDVLAARGRIVLMSGLGARPQLPVGPLYTRDGSIVGFAISNANLAELADAARTVSQIVAQRALAVRELEVLPLSAVAGEDGASGLAYEMSCIWVMQSAASP